MALNKKEQPEAKFETVKNKDLVEKALQQTLSNIAVDPETESIKKETLSLLENIADTITEESREKSDSLLDDLKRKEQVIATLTKDLRNLNEELRQKEAKNAYLANQQYQKPAPVRSELGSHYIQIAKDMKVQSEKTKSLKTQLELKETKLKELANLKELAIQKDSNLILLKDQLAFQDLKLTETVKQKDWKIDFLKQEVADRDEKIEALIKQQQINKASPMTEKDICMVGAMKELDAMKEVLKHKSAAIQLLEYRVNHGIALSNTIAACRDEVIKNLNMKLLAKGTPTVQPKVELKVSPNAKIVQMKADAILESAKDDVWTAMKAGIATRDETIRKMKSHIKLQDENLVCLNKQIEEKLGTIAMLKKQLEEAKGINENTWMKVTKQEDVAAEDLHEQLEAQKETTEDLKYKMVKKAIVL